MIRLWDTAGGQVLRDFETDSGSTARVGLSADGRWLATPLSDGRVRLWDPRTGTVRGELVGHSGGTTCLAFGLGSQALATGGRDGTVAVWDLARRKVLKKFAAHTGAVSSVVFNSRGDGLATGGDDTTVRISDTVSGEENARFRGHGGAVTALAFGPRDRRLASGGWDRTVRVWDLKSGQSLELTGLTGGVRAAAFRADGRELLVGGGKVVRSWDPATGRPGRTVATFTAAVLAAALSPDASTLAVGGGDGLIRLVDVETASERSVLEGHRGPVVSVEYGPNGLLASASAGVSVVVRPTPPSRPEIELPPSIGARCIDPDQAWADLAGGPRAAIAVLRALGTHPEFAVSLLRDRLQPASASVPRDPASGAALRELRAVELLARLGTSEARALLESLAGGVPDAAVSAAAAAVLARMS
jgi:WD40 repeat protein